MQFVPYLLVNRSLIYMLLIHNKNPQKVIKKSKGIIGREIFSFIIDTINASVNLK